MTDLQGIITKLDQLEKDHRDSRDILIEIRTDLKHMDSKIDAHNLRINKRETENEAIAKRVEDIEKKQSEGDGRDKERKQNDDKRFKKWGIMIIAAEIVVAVIVAILIKVVWK